MEKDRKAKMISNPKKRYLGKYFWLVLFLHFGGFGICQSGPQSAFDIGNKHFQQSEYIEAINVYESILSENNIKDRKLYYNLGTAYLKLNQKGKAILFLERAKILAPRNKDIVENLNIAYHLTEDDFSVIPDFFLKRWVHNMSSSMDSSYWAVLSILFLLMGIGALLSWLFTTNTRIKKPSFFIGVVLILMTLSAIVLGHIKQDRELHNPFAIIMTESIILRIAPDQVSKEIFPIHEGLKVKILDKIGDWSKIELSNKEVGWIPSSGLEII